jgi:hypothetical protein
MDNAHAFFRIDPIRKSNKALYGESGGGARTRREGNGANFVVGGVCHVQRNTVRGHTQPLREAELSTRTHPVHVPSCLGPRYKAHHPCTTRPCPHPRRVRVGQTDGVVPSRGD